MKLDREEAMRMIREGMSYSEVAEQFFCTRNLLVHYFGPEYRSNKKLNKQLLEMNRSFVKCRRRIIDASAEATSKVDFGKRINAILRSLEVALFAHFEPSESQEQAA